MNHTSNLLNDFHEAYHLIYLLIHPSCRFPDLYNVCRVRDQL